MTYDNLMLMNYILTEKKRW